jgi:hypothetical protein
MRIARRLLAVSTVAVVGVGLTSCDPSPDGSASSSVATTSSRPSPTRSPGPTSTPAYVAPSPSPADGKTDGIVLGEQAFLTGSGGVRLVAELVTTSLSGEFSGPDPRVLDVWFRLTNVTHQPVRIAPGLEVTLTTPVGERVAAEPHPGPGQIDDDARRLMDVSGRNLAAPATISPGRTVDGVTVFEVLGGNGEITIDVAIPGGDPITFETHLGVF